MGRQTGNIYRTTISIPTSLKERMDAVVSQVNWSQVAVLAFEQKLAEIAASRKDSNVEGAVQRLRASKLRANDTSYKQGEAAGRTWAEHVAEADELQRLEDLADAPAADDWHRMALGAYGLANHVLGCIRNDKGDSGWFSVDRGDSEEFWESVLDNEYPEGPLLQGFVEGAVAFWREVKDKL